MSATTGGHSLNLMACVRESSPPQDSGVEADSTRHETKRRRFHPFRGLRRIFRRKVRHSGTVMPTPDVAAPPSDAQTTPLTLDPHRSRSTSQLLAGDQPTRRRSGSGLYGPHGAGLSVSHDSVFSAEQHSEPSSSEDLAQSSSSLSIQQLVLPGVKAELFDAVRRRRGGRGDTSEDDEDLGLPRSPCISPTTVDVLLERHKEHPTKSRSTCSDGSLLSMGSSEMDEDSLGNHSGHSSKHSLHDKKLFHDNESEFDLGISAATLSHSAARHKMSVKPKRTHGAPRRRRTQQLPVVSELPTTPELNEDSARSFSPDASSFSGLTSDLTASTEPLDWLPNDCPTETQLKSSSLPPGLALTSDVQALLPRSHSSATKETAPLYKRHLSSSALETKEPKEPNQIGAEVLRARELLEEDEEDVDEKKKEESFFGRLLSRRSGKKKKDKSDDEEVKPVAVEIPKKRIDVKGGYANEKAFESRSKIPLRPRQRVEPIDLPAEIDIDDKLVESLGTSPIKPSMLANLPMKHEILGTSPTKPKMIGTLPLKYDIVGPTKNDVLATSPIKSEIFESSLLQREILSTSPTKPDVLNRMHVAYSVSPPKPTWPEGSTYFKPDPDTKIVDFVAKSKPEEPILQPKLRIGGPTSYHQKVINMNENQDERDYSSMIHTSTNGQGFHRVDVVLKKSKSFRDNDSSSIENNLPKESLNFINQDKIEMKSNIPLVNNKTALDVDIHLESIYKDIPADNEIVVPPSLKMEDHKSIFTKNITVTTRSVAREKVTQDIVKKSLSLESIGHVESPTPAKEKSSSSESISRSTSAINAAGISITQTTAMNRSECSPIADQSQSAMPITVSITSKPAFEKAVEVEEPVSELSSPAKRDSLRNGNDVPEFLRVHLNRVDSKPTINVVLSTSAIFDAAETSPSDKSIVSSSPVEKQEFAEVVEREPQEEVPKVSLLALRIKKPSVEELDSPVEAPRVEKLENFTLRTQELIQKPFDGRMEPVPKPRSISLLNPGVKKNISPVTPLRPSLRKQSSSVDSDDGNRRTFNTDFDNIQIVEKDVISNSKPVEAETEPVKSPVRRKSWKAEESIVIMEKSTSGDESPEVVLRKKSRDLSQRKDDEPELLKVFARRSLKIKDSDTESFSQLVTAKTRDSDKENESDSPREERKKLTVKEPLIESKPRSEEPSLKISTIPSAPKQAIKYQRSLSMIGTPVPVDNNTTKENDAVPNLLHRKSETCFPHRWANINRDKEIDLTNSELPKQAAVEVKPDGDENMPRFKRIQQRREEWEQRAQQAAIKKTIP